MKQVIEYKSIPGDSSVKDVDTKQGIITGYFSIFGNVDSDGDVIMPGAFKKSLSDNYRRVKHLYQHDPFRPLAGTRNDMLKVMEDSKGLYFESKISQTSYGKDVIQLYADGVLDEHSIGFVTVRSNDKKSYRELTELKLFEGSSVTWAANDQAQVASVKHLTKDNAVSKTDRIMKALRDGRYETDEAWDMLEIYLKQMQQLIIELSTSQPEFTNHHTEPAPTRDWKSITNFLMQ